MYFRLVRAFTLVIFGCLFSFGAAAQSRVNTDSLKQEIARKRDSMMTANKQRVDSIKAAVASRRDSMRQATERRVDSMTAARKNIMDSIQVIRERRTDSIAAIKKYRSSRQYRDSIEQRKQAFKDSLSTIRIARLDSMKEEQLRFADSMKTARNQIRDSIQTVVQNRKDSIQQARDDLIAEREGRKKGEKPLTEEEKTQKKIAEKHEKEKEEYDNSKFLKKPWRFPRNALQNTYTRYNYYYNADLMFGDMLERVYRLQKINYDSIVDVHKIVPKNSSKYGGTTPDDIIKKASLDIQMHDPRSKWQDDLYYLIAKSYYYKNDYDYSIPYIKFIITNFNGEDEKSNKKKKGKSRRGNKRNQIVQTMVDKDGKKTKVISICTKEPQGAFKWMKHRPIRNDALMLLTRSYVDEGYNEEALSLLNQMTSDINFPNRLEPEADKIKAQIYINNEDYAQASEFVVKAIENTKKKKDRTRLYYLQGQIFEQYDKFDSAYLAFESVIESNPEIDIASHASDQMTELIYKNKWTDKVAKTDRSLSKMLRQDKYNPYFSLLHFDKGLLALVRGDEAAAEEEFTASIENESENPDEKQKALQQLIAFYYNDHNYIQANKYYTILSESELPEHIDGVPYPTLIPELAKNQEAWLHADSMFYLASLSDRDQLKWAKAQAAKDGQSTEGGFEKLTPTNPAAPGPGRKSNFYFANANLVAKGQAQFKKVWGGVQNDDMWAISALNKNATNQSEIPEQITNSGNGATEQVDGEYAKYLSQIPKTKEQRDQLKFSEQEAIYNLGNLHYRDMNEPEQANVYYDTLLSMFPISEFRPKVLFNQYLIAEKQGDKETASTYKGMLQAQYPGSYTFIFDDYVEGARAKRRDTAMQVYSRMYDIFNAEQYGDLENFYSANSKYFKDFKEYEDKSRLLLIQAEMANEKYQDALVSTEVLLSTEPERDVLDFAERLKLAITKKLGINKVNTKVDTGATDSVMMSLRKYDPSFKTQLVISLLPTEKANDMKIKISDFNKSFFNDKTYTSSERLLPDGTKIVLVYNFGELEEATKYKEKIIEQWDSSIAMGKASDHDYFMVNPQYLNVLYQPGGYEAYMEFFRENYE